MSREKILFKKVIDLMEQGDFSPAEIEYKPGTSFATLYGDYTPIGGDDLKAELYVEFKEPLEDPLDVLDVGWTYWQISDIVIDEWSTEALLNRAKYMVYDLGFISDDSPLKATFYPSYLKLNPDADMETRFIKCYGTYKFILPDRDEEIFGELEIELDDYVKVGSKYIDDYLYKRWSNFVVDDAKVLDLIEQLEKELE